MESTATDRTESRSLKTQPRDNPEAIATRAINFRTAIFAKANTTLHNTAAPTHGTKEGNTHLP